jgi:ABC-type transport system involved in cytochrome c biogenesis permease subunit
MYLVQARRLRRKTNPLGGMKILSLERLEAMNRRAINAAFPLLTAGLLLGGVLLRQEHGVAQQWYSLKVLGTGGLWVVSLLLLYMRYGVHVAGRRLAWLSILAFLVMLGVLMATHPFAATIEGGTP